MASVFIVRQRDGIEQQIGRVSLTVPPPVPLDHLDGWSAREKHGLVWLHQLLMLLLGIVRQHCHQPGC